MNIEKARAIAQELFKNHPSVNSFFITTDGQAFFSSPNAETHAVTLDKKNPTVFEVNREVSEDDSENKVTNAKGAAAAAGLSAAEKLSAAKNAFTKAGDAETNLATKLASEKEKFASATQKAQKEKLSLSISNLETKLADAKEVTAKANDAVNAAQAELDAES